ncbi:MAG TPA: DEAD/DEAH box helicase [Egibacteraceae bacterium]|nr:DEAD/DEAH box helicase [Egibacteraceae bacterium]
MDAAALLSRLDERLTRALPAAGGRRRLAQLQRLPARPARLVALPGDLPESLALRLRLRGVEQLYEHQAEALEHVRAGRNVVVATGTASGKSLCYQLPLAQRLLADSKATALYLAPTKALARDQLRSLRDLRLPQIRAAAYDGDTPRAEREAIRRTANVVLSNPDMLHAGLLAAHRRWADFFHRLALVVVDECHVARGVFGSHVGAILRRLRRVCDHYAAAPAFVLASATIANPAEHAGHLTGLEVSEVVRDGSPRPPVAFGLWEPPLVDPRSGARRSTLTEAADVLAGLVGAGRATLAFVKSRKGAELVAAHARRLLGPAGDARGNGAPRVTAYRAGFLPEERRAVEQGLMDGTLRGVAATDALELGVDVGGLDAVVIAGWPGTAASLWQQAGRAGRRKREAAVVFVADDDPLDHYLLAHPAQLWGRPPEAAVVDITNPYVLAPHLRCAAWELPLSRVERAFAPADLDPLVEAETAQGRLRERGGRLFSTGRSSPAAALSIRGTAGEPFAIVDADTGALIGDADETRAHRTVHPGAVYLHQGETYRIRGLDLARRTALAEPYRGDEYTRARTDTDVGVLRVDESVQWGRCRLHLGPVAVSTQVLAYERRRLFSDESLGLVALDLPRLHLVTKALWLTIPDDVLAAAGLAPAQVPGAAHAAEHAAIGLLPLFAMCDRWDVGGMSTARHRDTGQATIFVYDGYPGGAGIAERGYRAGEAHQRTTLAAIASCPCTRGCPSCVQSPKCGNGNEPLDKAGAAALLRAVLGERASGLSGAPAATG